MEILSDENWSTGAGAARKVGAPNRPRRALGDITNASSKVGARGGGAKLAGRAREAQRALRCGGGGGAVGAARMTTVPSTSAAPTPPEQMEHAFLDAPALDYLSISGLYVEKLVIAAHGERVKVSMGNGSVQPESPRSPPEGARAVTPRPTAHSHLRST
eukprot:COSAG05_NODE_5910_length_1061_cov_0.843035_3_plen_159_part_00